MPQPCLPAGRLQAAVWITLRSPSPHGEQPLRLRDALERLLAPILEAHARRGAHQPPRRGSIAGLSYAIGQRFGLVGLGPKESIDLIQRSLNVAGLVVEVRRESEDISSGRNNHLPRT